MEASYALLIGLLAVTTPLSYVKAAAAGTGLDLGLISLPANGQACQCSLTMSCSCCQSVTVNLMNETSTLCLTVKIGLSSGSIDLGATMDGNSVAAIAISTSKPPQFCIPVISMASLDICLKVNIKMAGLAAKACPTFYTDFSSSQVVTYDFPCIQVGLDGVSLV
ncbi:uncharacterized protein LOC108088360 [Drosophila ficusphila]|uniref:uncharacterized protein LOC108088360 n=1 Tax=Drosophila ficusphila TaxID=30025 RepID=UPI0007E83CBF|nr:uncharacterized protein LOC108088360 [Drosophila ficusphila]